jgi:uncharacterized protein
MLPIIDVHSHWSTKKGYVFQTQAELAVQKAVFDSAPTYQTEAEMAEDFRANNVKAILDLYFPADLSIEEMASLNDYGFEVERQYPEQILGHWIHIAPRHGKGGVKELRRCIEKRTGFLGFGLSGSSRGLPATDPAFEPYLKLCIEAKVPALIFVGTTTRGSGQPGGRGVILEHCHPRYLDAVAARYPELTIVAGRPGWPWQTETIATLLHKSNIWYEVHGWSPKYFTDDLKREIGKRLQDRILFGGDYPLFTYERLRNDWIDLGYPDVILNKVFHQNAERFLQQTIPMGRGNTLTV